MSRSLYAVVETSGGSPVSVCLADPVASARDHVDRIRGSYGAAAPRFQLVGGRRTFLAPPGEK
jgi:hypothetical protein